MFRAAFAAAVLALLALPASAAAQANDNRADAIALGIGTSHTANTASATEEPGERLTRDDPSGDGCGYLNNLPDDEGVLLGKTIWYTVIGNGQTLTAHAFGSSFDTLLAVYEGASVLACNDDFQQVANSPAFVRFPSQHGVVYHLQLGGFCPRGPGPCLGGATRISVTSPPANDERAAPIALTLGAPLSGATNLGATESPGEHLACGASPFGATVWYRVDVGGPGTLAFNVSGAGVVKTAAIYAGGAAAPLACAVSASTAADVSASVGAGAHFLQVGGVRKGLDASWGSFNVTAGFTPAPTATPTPTPTPPKTKPKPKNASIPFKGGYQTGGIPRKSACKGKVTLTLKRKKKTLQTRRTKLNRKCDYRVTFKVARKKIGSAKRLTVVVRFHGNRFLAATTNRFTVKVPA